MPGDLQGTGAPAELDFKGILNQGESYSCKGRDDEGKGRKRITALVLFLLGKSGH